MSRSIVNPSYIVVLYCLLCSSTFSLNAQDIDFAIGVIADCQYCNDPGSGVRKYAASLGKLSECVRHFNTENLAYVIHLGDFIDRDFESYAVVKPIFDSLKAPGYHVLGNHDFSVEDQYKNSIPTLLKIPSRYRYFDLNGWRFIILDGNDLSFHAYPEGSDAYLKSAEYYESKKITSPKWNGAIGFDQLSWLTETLDNAEQSGLKVMLYCHFPIYPANIHNLWNADEVLDLLSNYSCVKAYVNGHNHAGNYAMSKDIHYLTLKGMVDTEENSFCILRFKEGNLEVEGHGREIDRMLRFK